MYINTNTLEKTSLRQIKQAHPNISFPPSPTDEQLSPLGYANLIPTSHPAGDVVTEGFPEQSQDGSWHQTWDVREYTDTEKSEMLSQAKVEKRNEINQKREEVINQGLPYTINGTPDVIQTRPQDKVNILGLFLEAQLLDAQGVTSPVMTFRAESDEEYQLTPQDMITLAQNALQHIKSIYQQSWNLKDQVNGALTLSEVEAISWSN